MYELNQITPKVYTIECPAKIGVVKLNEADVILIDAGSDKNAGRKVRQILERQGWNLKAIYSTHSNADHIGGNQYLQKQTGCAIYAPEIEDAFSRDPILEPSFLYGGYPNRQLRHKFLMAQPSDVQTLHPEDLPEGISMISLPGHFFNMVGFQTDDGVIFLADCLSSQETLDKYQIGFIYDVQAYLDTLEKVKNLQADWFIPAHAGSCQEISGLAQANTDKVYEIAEKILEFAREGISSEDLLAKLFAHYDLKMNFEQYVLIGSTVRSYLSWLLDAGKLSAEFKDNYLIYQTV